jgi:hypothetical protein
MSREIHINQEEGKFILTSSEKTVYNDAVQALELSAKQRTGLINYRRVLYFAAASSFAIGGYTIYQGHKENNPSLVYQGVGIATAGMNFIWPGIINSVRINVLNEKISAIKTHIQSK